MKARVKIVCDYCGKKFGIGNTGGIPNGISMIGKDDNIITLCSGCIIKLGEMNKAEKDKFFETLSKRGK